MPRKFHRWAAAGVALALAAAAVSGAHAQQKRSRNVLVKPDHPFGDVQLDLQLEIVPGGAGRRQRNDVGNGDAVRIGERVVICFTVSQGGYVTLWSRDAEGNTPARIYPNEYAAETADDRGAVVLGDAETCIGDDDGFRLEVALPLGEAALYLHYTREAGEQFDEDAYPQVRGTRDPDDRPYASRYLTYRVVE